MLTKILNLILITATIPIIYFSNTNVIDITLFLFLMFYTINNNYFSLLFIIPIFFINPIMFMLFLLIYLFLLSVNKLIKNNLVKSVIYFIGTLIFLLYDYLTHQTNTYLLIVILCLCTLVITLNYLNKVLYRKTIDHILVLSVFIFNIGYINIMFLLVYFLRFVAVESILNKNAYYFFTAFLISAYGYIVTAEILYFIIQLMAYLGYLFLISNKSKKIDNQIEYLLEDININVSNFCSFINNFGQTLNGNDYDRRLSSAIKILIERYCANCQRKGVCFANQKIKTYIYIKQLLTKKQQINSEHEVASLFDCKYYYKMAEDAMKLQHEYKLNQPEELENYKLISISSSIQNYFISLFEKSSLEITKLINFKKGLIDENILFDNITYSIIDNNNFIFKIYSNNKKDLINIYQYSLSYFSKNKTTINLLSNYVSISPKKNYKIQYDQAVLSVNNLGVSGDNVLVKTINDTDFICALSDGMGSGYSAYKLSEETLRLLDKITDCNIAFDVALEILNNFFKVKDHYDKYATLDLVEINLITGVLNLYKLGSSTTYISRGDAIIPIYNNNLPFGISDLITKEEIKLKNDDLIILVSDGVNDYVSEAVLSNFINNIKHESPHKIVYEVLQLIYHQNNYFAKDDMSCIAIKIKCI